MTKAEISFVNENFVGVEIDLGHVLKKVVIEVMRYDHQEPDPKADNDVDFYGYTDLDFAVLMVEDGEDGHVDYHYNSINGHAYGSLDYSLVDIVYNTILKEGL